MKSRTAKGAGYCKCVYVRTNGKLRSEKLFIKFVRTKRMAPILEHEGKCTIFLKHKFQKEHNRKEWQKIVKNTQN